MTENVTMILTAQFQKIAIKKGASLPSSIRQPDIEFRKLVDILDHYC